MRRANRKIKQDNEVNRDEMQEAVHKGATFKEIAWRGKPCRLGKNFTGRGRVRTKALGQEGDGLDECQCSWMLWVKRGKARAESVR